MYILLYLYIIYFLYGFLKFVYTFVFVYTYDLINIRKKTKMLPINLVKCMVNY